MPFVDVSVDDRAFLEGFRLAMDAYRKLGEDYAVMTADHVVAVAKGLVPVGIDLRDPPGRLRESIRRDLPVREGNTRVSVSVHAGGPGIRETLPVEFGTYKMRAQPYMRPALELAAGALGSLGIAVRSQTTHAAHVTLKRARAITVIRRTKKRQARRRRG